MNTNSTFNVLFLCTGNSARSILAEAILNKLGKGRFTAYSAGSHPKGDVHPMALRILSNLGYDIAFARSKSWEEFGQLDSPKMDFVFTVCDNAANEACPHWPGQPMTAHWGIPDPAEVTESEQRQHMAFAEAYKRMHTRIELFTQLPITALDRLSLQNQLQGIGETSDL